MSRRQLLAGVAGAAALGLARPAGLVAAETPTPASGPLSVHPGNGRYFTDPSGQAVYLTGSHTWDNLQDMGPADPPAAFDFEKYLDFLERHGHNFTRGWNLESAMWEIKKNQFIDKDAIHHIAPHPWPRTGPGMALDGKPKFDLTKFDPRYFDRLAARATQAGQRGIYISIMFFEGCLLQFAKVSWESHPFHPSNNINGLDGGGPLAVHTLGKAAVTAAQEAYVRQCVDTVNDMDNVLYEIANETHPGSTPWQYHLIRFVKEYERGKPKQHPVGMTFQYSGGSNKTLFDSPADWVSPNFDGGYRDNPPAGDGKKVVLSDTDHLWGLGGSADWVWRSFTRGLNPIFMDPYVGVIYPANDAAYDPIRRAMGHTRRLAQRVNLGATTPRGDSASTGYCLAQPGTAYIAYLPSGGEVELDLSSASGPLAVEWIHPVEGGVTRGEPTAGGGKVKFKSPLTGSAVLFLRA